MCGICGIISKDKVTSEERSLIQEMSNTLIHRGPDDSGYFEYNNIALAHRRLSIIDLSSAGHQPMEYMERYTIVFNGEIYNYLELRKELQDAGYKFNSNTDTEVIMASYDYWKYECFSHFNGMWALALFDKQKNKLILSRDRFGIKPLYYYQSEEKILFASEIKALLCDKTIRRFANNSIVYDYLLEGKIEHTCETFFENIFKVPSGTYCIINDTFIIQPIVYHTMNFSQQLVGCYNKRMEKEFKDKFRKAVLYRLHADVSVGSCLSGGLDSSSIVCCIHDIYRSINNTKKQYTFSYRSEDKRLDEYKYMDQVIKNTNVEPYFVMPESSDLINDLDKLIYTQDEPFLSTSIYASYRVYQEASRHGIKVLLDGQGADELLCGYRKSRLYFLKALIRQQHYIIFLIELFSNFSQIKTSFFTQSGLKSDVYKIKNVLLNKKINFVKHKYLNKDFVEKTKKSDLNSYATDFQYNDVYKFSLPGLLRYADRNSMAFGVESRLPFLDIEFAEFCADLPLTTKIKHGYTKYIMRKSLSMPELVRKRKDKIGFATPEDEWIKKGEPYFKKIFEQSNFKAQRFINNIAILDDWSNILNKNKIPYIFRLLCLEKWMELYNVE